MRPRCSSGRRTTAACAACCRAFKFGWYVRFNTFVHDWSPSVHLDRYILEKYYGLHVARMLVACFHPDVGDTPFLDDVPPLTSEVESMMHEQRRRHLSVGILHARGSAGIAFRRSPALSECVRATGACLSMSSSTRERVPDDVRPLTAEVESMMHEQRRRHLSVGILHGRGSVGIAFRISPALSECVRAIGACPSISNSTGERGAVDYVPRWHTKGQTNFARPGLLHMLVRKRERGVP